MSELRNAIWHILDGVWVGDTGADLGLKVDAILALIAPLEEIMPEYLDRVIVERMYNQWAARVVLLPESVGAERVEVDAIAPTIDGAIRAAVLKVQGGD